MEGRWGRRIFGAVRKSDAITTFHLELETREGNFITSVIRVSNEDLEHWPGEYGQILNKMVEQIDQRINHIRGDQP